MVADSDVSHLPGVRDTQGRGPAKLETWAIGERQPVTGAETDETGILVQTAYPRWNPLLWLCQTGVSIDGVTTKLPWGEAFVPVDPGSHEVQVWVTGGVSGGVSGFTYFGLQTVSVRVVAGQTQVVRCRSPWWPLFAGQISSEHSVDG